MKKYIITCIFLLVIIVVLVWGIAFVYKTDFSSLKKDEVVDKDEVNFDDTNDDISEDAINVDNEYNNFQDINANNDNIKREDSINKKTENNSAVEALPDEFSKFTTPTPSTDVKKYNYFTMTDTTCYVKVQDDGLIYDTTVQAIFRDKLLASIKMQYVIDFHEIKDDILVEELEKAKEEFKASMSEMPGFTYSVNNTDDSLTLSFHGDIDKLKNLYSEDFLQEGDYYDNFIKDMQDDGLTCRSDSKVVTEAVYR